ncbi:MAG: hypothetical protein HYZ42_16135, partial [Bacteroidetes bacterium]|nr:hypothetical protein [Bacteroidota bacterium]
MKKTYLLTLISLFFTLNLVAQTPTWKQLEGRFWPDDSAIWSVLQEVKNGSFYEYAPSYYKMIGDTIQNGVSYKKVYKGKEKSYTISHLDTFYSFLRLSDSIGSIVSIKYPYTRFDDTSEFMLYNFTLKYLDTSYIKFVNNKNPRLFDSIGCWELYNISSCSYQTANQNLEFGSCVTLFDGQPNYLADSIYIYFGGISSINKNNSVRFTSHLKFAHVGFAPRHPFYAECDT